MNPQESPKDSAKHKTNLNQKQLELLKLVYKFRFVTSSLLAEYKHISTISMNKSLAVLTERGYIARQYEKSYRLLGKGARYCLLLKGFNLLKDRYALGMQTVKPLYKNNSLSKNEIDHYLAVLRLYLKLEHIYGDAFNIFTKIELGEYNYFPKTLPDLYLNRIRHTHTNKPNEYMLYECGGMRLVVMRVLARELRVHFESGEWEECAETDYPTVIFTCPNNTTKKKIQGLVEKTFDGNGIDYLASLNTNPSIGIIP